ncbi:MAG: pilus assembly protein [Pseudomonadota bacterium]|nr:VWA domain-containing protein [Afipia sp.]
MNDASIFNRVRGSLARFRRAEGGNVAVLFAIAIVPLLGFVGAAVDYARVNNARTAMQSALDTAALMISKDANNLTTAQINQKAQAYFNALFKHPEAQNVTVSAVYTNSTSQGSKVVLTGSGSMDTDFMKMVGLPKLDFGASSTTVWGTTKLRVALALDNTGSMASSGKMDALKTSAKSLIDTLKGAAKTDGDVYISIVPFAKDVNVGSTNRNAPWLKWSDQSDTWDENNGTCNNYKNYYGWGSPSTKSDCLNYGGTWTPDNHNTWNGCVTDRDQDYDTTSTPPSTAVSATLFPAEQYASCPQQITPLSYDWTMLKNNVDAMQPVGGTNQSIGVAWAWLSLLQQAPLNAPPEDPNFKYNKVIILLSDGDNTQYRNPAYGNGSTQFNGQIDARQRLLCDNAKTAGVQIYTIQVNTNNDNNSSVMSYCATSSSTYFSTTSASGINTAFSSIGTALSKLRIAK